jgi:acylphosphatase
LLTGSSMVHHVHVTVRGRVQGVGYRNWTYSQAKLLKLNGWVKNLPEGAVEITLEGPEGPLQSLLTFLKTGPALAKVSSVEARWTSVPKPQFNEFMIKR